MLMGGGARTGPASRWVEVAGGGRRRLVGSTPTQQSKRGVRAGQSATPLYGRTRGGEPKVGAPVACQPSIRRFTRRATQRNRVTAN
jgi:hypothetical protein